MSIKVMERVWRHSQHGGVHLLALLAIADAANEDGEGYIKRSTIARRMRREQTAAKRAIAELVESGELTVIGKTKNRVNIYRVLTGMEAVEGGENAPLDEETMLLEGGENAPLEGGENAPLTEQYRGRKRPIEGGENAPLRGAKTPHSINKEINRPLNRPLTGAGGSMKNRFDAICEICGWDEAKDPRIATEVPNRLAQWVGLVKDFDADGMPALRRIMERYAAANPGRVPAVAYIDKALRSELAGMDAGPECFADKLPMDRTRAWRIKAWLAENFWLPTYGPEPSRAECDMVRGALGLPAATAEG